MSKYEWPRNQYRHERAQDLQNERIENGIFRCDRCACLKPMPPKIEDGMRHCRRCSDPLIPSEAMRLLGEEKSRAAGAVMAMLPYPVTSVFASDPVITDVSPLSLSLSVGGSGTINITGANLSVSDTWDGAILDGSLVLPPGIITITPTVNSSTSVTLSVLNGTVNSTFDRGNYSILFNGDVITPRGIIKIR